MHREKGNTHQIVAGVVALLLALAIPASLVVQHAAAASKKDVPAAPDYWPTEGWRESTPEEQGFDSGELLELFDYVKQQKVNVHSVLIIRNGRVVLDAYFYPYDPERPHDVASCTKSVTATLIGRLIGDKKLSSVDNSVLPYFGGEPVANLTADKKRLTVRDLLTMQSGLECDPKQSERTLREMKQTEEWVRFMLNRPMANAPGKKFNYCSGGMHVLSGLITQVTGESADEYARKNLFEPLGIRDYTWPRDRRGITHGWGDLHLKPRDMAKIGFLWLHNGVWEGKQLLPPEWVAEGKHREAKTGLEADYGYGWWIFKGNREGDFEAVGRGGQRISVIPSKNAIVVFTGGIFEPGPLGAIVSAALRSDRALPSNPTAFSRLKEQLAAARLSAEAPARLGSAPAPDLSKVFSFPVNVFEISSVAIKSSRAGTGEIAIRLVDGEENRHPLTFDGGWKTAPGGRYGLPVLIRARWENNAVLEIDYDEAANINAYTFRIEFGPAGAVVTVNPRGAKQPTTLIGTDSSAN